MPLTYHPTHCAKNQSLTHLTQHGKIIFDALKKISIIQIAPTIFGAKIQTIRFKSQLAQIKDLLSLLEKKLFICPEIHISFKESSGLVHNVCLFEFSCQNYTIYNSSSFVYLSTLDKSQFV